MREGEKIRGRTRKQKYLEALLPGLLDLLPEQKRQTLFPLLLLLILILSSRLLRLPFFGEKGALLIEESIEFNDESINFCRVLALELEEVLEVGNNLRERKRSIRRPRRGRRGRRYDKEGEKTELTKENKNEEKRRKYLRDGGASPRVG